MRLLLLLFQSDCKFKSNWRAVIIFKINVFKINYIYNYYCTILYHLTLTVVEATFYLFVSRFIHTALFLIYYYTYINFMYL